MRSYTGPTDEQVHALYAQLSLAGAAVSVEDTRRLLNVTPDRVQKFLDEYNRPGGIQRWQTQVVNLFFQLAAKSRATGVVLRTSNHEVSPIVVSPVAQESSTQDDVCFYSSALSVYSGVIALSCPICAAVAGTISVISGAVGLVTCNF